LFEFVRSDVGFPWKPDTICCAAILIIEVEKAFNIYSCFKSFESTHLPAALPAALPKLRELYLAKNPSLLTVPDTFKNVGSFQELEILDISTHFSIWEAGVKKVFPSYDFFTWFDGCSTLRELYFEGYKMTRASLNAQQAWL
jgi:hypothetical protein